MLKNSYPLSVAILYYAGTHEDDKDTITGVKGIEESLKRTGHNVVKVVVTKKIGGNPENPQRYSL